MRLAIIGTGEDGEGIRQGHRSQARGNEAAKDIVFELARDMGFHPVDVGPLKAARELERLVGLMLFVKLGPLRVLSR